MGPKPLGTLSDVANPTDVWAVKCMTHVSVEKLPLREQCVQPVAVAPITLRMSGIQRLRHDLGAPRGGWRWRIHPIANPTYMRAAANNPVPHASDFTRVTTGRLSQLRDTAGVGLGQRERNKQTPIKLAPATDEWARIPTPHVSYSGQ